VTNSMEYVSQAVEVPSVGNHKLSVRHRTKLLLDQLNPIRTTNIYFCNEVIKRADSSL